MPAKPPTQAVAATAASRPSPLATAQVGSPQLPPGFIVRERLIDRIERGVKAGIVVVAAPAGAGKTLLLASWAARRPTPVAWLTVHPDDAEPGQFWGLVVTAIRVSGAVAPESTLATMTPPPRFDERFVLHLLDACEELAEPVVLVIDDLHVLGDSPAVRSLADAIQRGLGNLRLIISTRTAPALPLQRLRLRDALTEIQVSDLAFTESEAGDLLRRRDLDLDDAQLATVMERTEGWAAGLRLAALALQGRGDVATAVSLFAGDHRSVADYFVEEVLARQPPDLHHFLLHTCVVRQLCGDLAEALTGHSGGQRMLERLERANLFIVAIDERRAWYRYHHLFLDLLRHRLNAEHPELVEQLHRRAAAWFAEHQEPLEAVRHLAAAGDWPAVARYVNRSAGALLLGADRHALIALLRQIPASVVDTDPEAATAAATTSYASYDAAGVHTHARRARELLHLLDPDAANVVVAILTTLDAIAAWLDQDAETLVLRSTEALKRLGDVSAAEMPSLPMYVAATRVIAAMGLVWTGQLGPAEDSLQGMADSLAARSALTPVIAVHLHGHLAILKAFRGKLRDARQHAQIVKSIAEQSGWLFLPQSAPAELALAVVHLLRDEQAECELAIQRGLSRQGDLPDRFTETALHLAQARLLISSGDIDRARRLVRESRDSAVTWSMPTFLARWYDLVEAEIDLAAGEAQAVLDRLSVASGQKPPGERPRANEVVRRASALLAAARPEEALTTLAPLHASQPPDVAPAVETWVLTAVAEDRRHRDVEAQSALSRALDLAVPEGIVRPFLTYGHQLRHLLLRHQQESAAHGEFVASLIGRLNGVAGRRDYGPLVEPLTDRERSVLALLPTMMSNHEIATELFVSVNTIKTHLKSLYRKLGVTGRREAVLAARELGELTAATVRRPAG